MRGFNELIKNLDTQLLKDEIKFLDCVLNPNEDDSLSDYGVTVAEQRKKLIQKELVKRCLNNE